MEPATPPFKSLSTHQISIIKESWKIVYANPVESGETIFFTFLTRYPEHQKRYSALKNTPLAELKGTEAMANHSEKIIQIFNTVVNSIDNEVSLINSITENAKFHGRRGIKKEHYNQIREVIVEVLSSACNLDDEGKEAWNDFLNSFYHITFNVLDDLKK